ncbi:MAG TPA: biotin--[acetyl-CoA-carboxylase] ligase [Sediminibacterium sp.]|nr:biotin--[acetyl-CoA-carboxylase] ligase [Sediminibacterium sp.]
MSRSGVKTTIGSPFTQLSVVDSTNIYAMKQLQANLAAHGSAFFALEQTAGKGQRGRKWQANPGENILLSVVLDSSFLAVSQQFHLSMVVALATYDFLHRYIPDELSIKWPNDIYWRDRKTGGILLETSLSGNKWLWTVAGIGININQTSFPDLSKKAVSLKQITGINHDPVLLAKELCCCIDQRYRELKKKGSIPLLNAYRERLHKRGEWVRLKKNNAVGKYLIQSVSEQGELVVEAGMEYVFTHGSIEWIG